MVSIVIGEQEMELSVHLHMEEVVIFVKLLVSGKLITDEYVAMVHSTHETNNVMIITPPITTVVPTQGVILKHRRVRSMQPQVL